MAMMILIVLKQNDGVNDNKVVEDDLFKWIYHDLENVMQKNN